MNDNVIDSLRKMRKDTDFSDLMHIHAREVLEYLLRFQHRFDVYAELEFIEFDPELPQSIVSNWNSRYIFFTIANYTLSTAAVNENELTFRAGFGRENVASTLTIPIGCIIRISVDGVPVYINEGTYKERILREQVEESKKKLLEINKDDPDFERLKANAEREQKERDERLGRYGKKESPLEDDAEKKREQELQKSQTKLEMMKRAIEYSTKNEQSSEDAEVLKKLENAAKKLEEEQKGLSGVADSDENEASAEADKKEAEKSEKAEKKSEPAKSEPSKEPSKDNKNDSNAKKQKGGKNSGKKR